MRFANPMRKEERRPWRRLRLVVLTLATGLLLATAVAAIRQVAGTARSEVRGILAQAAQGNAAAISREFGESTQVTLIVARNPLLRADRPDRDQIARVLADTAVSDDSRVTSAALVDASGRVLVQVADGVTLDTSRDMRAEEFAQIAPTLELSLGVVRHSKPYLSKVSGRWVVAATTPIQPDHGRLRILVITRELGVMHEVLTVGDRRAQARLIQADGDVIASSALAGLDGAPIGFDSDREILRDPPVARTDLTRDGRSFSFAPVDMGPANANRWWIVTSMPAPGHGSTILAGGYATAMAVATMMLFVLGLLAFRRHRDSLTEARVTDPLTGLLNRAALDRRGTEVLARGAREGHMTAVLCLNLMRFHDINDALGHEAGDAVMLEVTRRLRSAIRDGDLLVRLGGDEFAVLLSRVTDQIGATEAARAVLASLYPPIDLGDRFVGVHATMGAALAPRDGTTIDELVIAAGRAMYAARREATDLVIFDVGIKPQPADGLSIVADLRAAMETDELRLHFQPKVSLTNGRVEGVEAFIRWRHPRLGMLPPSVFIPLAEETGLIAMITKKAITLALAQAREWLDEGLELPISVNLSGRSVQDLSTVEVVARGLARWQVPARLLELEITEADMINDPAMAQLVMDELDALGVRLSMDDYGTGYSSLMSMHSLPVREIKIDRTFVEVMKRAREDAEIVRSTIELGHSLGLRVVAEGVEDADAVRRLVDIGCDTAQGNFFCTPMPADELRYWLLERNGRATQKRTSSRAGRRG